MLGTRITCGSDFARDRLAGGGRAVLVLPPDEQAEIDALIQTLLADDDHAAGRCRLGAAIEGLRIRGAEGIKSMVLGAGDAAAAHRATQAQNFDAAPPVHVRREWVVAPGESVFPEFDVVLPVKAPLVFNCCQYHNVSLYLRPDWLVHPNAARGIRAVLAIAALSRERDCAWTRRALMLLEADQHRSADTHLLRLDVPALDGIDIYLKDESTHPTGSLKHRLARSLFLYGICDGRIRPDTAIVEASSGSTAVSEAYFARLIGLPFYAVQPRLAARRIDVRKLQAGRG